MTYQPGWSVVPQLLLQRERWPGGNSIQGIPLVSPGQHVLPDQPVLRIDPGPTIPSSQQSTASAALQPGPDGQMFPAGLRGRVISITPRGGVFIESRAALVQGTIGAGRQVAGVLTMWKSSLTSATGTLSLPPGALLVMPGPANFALLRQASISGVSGVIASSISLRDLEGFLQTDVLRLLNSRDIEAMQTTLPPLTLLFTEGSGTITMPARTIHLLRQYQGSIALLSGATSVKQRIRPELVISLPPQEVGQHWHPQKPETSLQVGVRVRICCGDYVGMMGEVDYLFTHQQAFSSGIRAPAARLRLDNDSLLVVPLTAIERAG